MYPSFTKSGRLDCIKRGGKCHFATQVCLMWRGQYAYPCRLGQRVAKQWALEGLVSTFITIATRLLSRECLIIHEESIVMVGAFFVQSRQCQTQCWCQCVLCSWAWQNFTCWLLCAQVVYSCDWGWFRYVGSQLFYCRWTKEGNKSTVSSFAISCLTLHTAWHACTCSSSMCLRVTCPRWIGFCIVKCKLVKEVDTASAPSLLLGPRLVVLACSTSPVAYCCVHCSTHCWMHLA